MGEPFDRIMVALRAARRARVSPWPGPRSLLVYGRVPATSMGPSCSAVVGSGQQAWRGHAEGRDCASAPDSAHHMPGILTHPDPAMGPFPSRNVSQIAQIPAFALKKIPGITAGAGSIIFNVLTVAVLTIYFLLGLPRGQAAAKTLLAGRHADRNIRILEESLARIGGYVSGNLLISIIAGTLAFAVLEILRVPFAAALGFWVAIADLIPNVGAMLGAVLCVIVALFSSVADGVAVAVYFVVYQRVENYFILPRIMTRAIDLSAPTVIITLLIGASLAGLEGALIALPIAAAVKVVIREVWLVGRKPSATPAAAASSDDAPPPETPSPAPGHAPPSESP
jgi:predicted PurR-regulated permease PerM